jgi:hypothetical protein
MAASLLGLTIRILGGAAAAWPRPLGAQRVERMRASARDQESAPAQPSELERRNLRSVLMLGVGA